ncbi:hypothetical protein AVEN_18105-1 [Araneus ventricosus]|uniref:SOCS box domain-containing protein n=1 Tax=Araneus ventricosus TaxID=182803 RepID=A0A4Y2R236_ARAVE|nr:hypothetical protein AVEN_18105-1 [Araneus ventricosus]
MRFPDAQTEISYNYVCTKEGLQKSLQPFQTKLLHSLHLDLCTGRQRIIRDFIDGRYMVNEARFHDYITIYDVKLQPYLYEMLLNGFIGNAIRNNVDVKKVPVIEMYLRLMKDEQFCRYSTFSSLRRPFFDILHQECSDSQLIVNILKVFNFEMWIISENYPEQVEFFLHHVHVLRKGNEILKTDMINACLRNRYTRTLKYFSNIKVLR